MKGRVISIVGGDLKCTNFSQIQGAVHLMSHDKDAHADILIDQCTIEGRFNVDIPNGSIKIRRSTFSDIADMAMSMGTLRVEQSTFEQHLFLGKFPEVKILSQTEIKKNLVTRKAVDEIEVNPREIGGDVKLKADSAILFFTSVNGSVDISAKTITALLQSTISGSIKMTAPEVVVGNNLISGPSVFKSDDFIILQNNIFDSKVRYDSVTGNCSFSSNTFGGTVKTNCP